MYDDSDDQVPPVYLAKTPVPLRSLATGREIRGKRKVEIHNLTFGRNFNV